MLIRKSDHTIAAFDDVLVVTGNIGNFIFRGLALAPTSPEYAATKVVAGNVRAYSRARFLEIVFDEVDDNIRVYNLFCAADLPDHQSAIDFYTNLSDPAWKPRTDVWEIDTSDFTPEFINVCKAISEFQGHQRTEPESTEELRLLQAPQDRPHRG